MPRRERPLEEGDGPLLRLAAGLRRLRREAGNPTYRELAKTAHYSASTLSAAAAGRQLPSLAVVVAFARACGADPAVWEEHWRVAAEEAAAGDGDGTPGPDAAPEEKNAPYAGLLAFRTDEAEWFFGRERLVAELIRKVTACRFTTLVGASGAGKSSLLHAGLLSQWPAEHPDWPVVALTPGPHPVEECAATLAAHTGESSGELYEALVRDPRALHRAVLQALAARPAETELLLVVDQFEEVFALCEDPVERGAFIEALITAAHAANSRCRIVVGVRADFYAHCTDHPRLVEAVGEAQVLIGPMTTDELGRAITRPAVRAGLAVEGALLAELVAQAKDQAAVLPLLSHALLEAWRRRRGNALTLAGFRATGGIDGALARTAETVYAALEPDGQRVARNVLLRLTAPGEGTEDTKRRVDRAELDFPGTDTATVLERFARARLLVLDQGGVEIAHEALIRRWPRLRGWLAEDREGLRIHRRLTEAATAWEAVQHDPGALYRGVRLDQAAEWAADWGKDTLSEREGRFLTASLAARAAARAAALRGARRLRTLLVLLAVLLLGTATATGIALVSRDQAQQQRDIAVSRQVAQQADALRRTEPALALQLALAAYRLHPTAAARGALLSSYATPYATQLRSKDKVDAVAFSPDGRLFAAAGADRTVRLWDATAPHLPHPSIVLPGRAASAAAVGVRAMAFSGDSRTLATTDALGTTTLWDLRAPHRPRARAVLNPPRAAAGPGHAAVAFSPDGRIVVSAGPSGTVARWPAASRGRPPATAVLGTLDGEVRSLAFAPDGHALAVAGPAGTRLWHLAHTSTDGDAQAVKAAETVRLPPANAVAFAPDGRTLATGGDDRAVRLWNPATLRPGGRPSPLTMLTGHTDTVFALAFAPDGRTLASAGVDADVRLWDTGVRPDDRTAVRLLGVLSGHTGYVTSAAFSPDGRTLATGASDQTARLWNLPLPALTGHTSSVYTVAFSPDGRTLATGSYDRAVRLWDVTHPLRSRPLSVLSGHTAAVNAVAFDPHRPVLASASLDRTVRLWDVGRPRTPRPLARVTGGTDAVNTVAFAPGGRLLAAGDGDGTVRLWDTGDPRRPRALSVVPAHSDEVESVAFSPDGRMLASAGRDHLARLWDVSRPGRPRPLALLDRHHDAVKTVAFAPDGRTLATGGDDRVLRLWDITQRTAPRPIASLGDYAGAVKAVAFAPNGGTLLTASERAVRMWDVRDPHRPAELAVLSGHTKQVDAVAFRPDGRLIATGSEDWTALLWDPDPERAATRVCRDVGRSVLGTADWRQYLPGLSYRPPCPAATAPADGP
ncbi:WD40 repeat domain-containing protein [Streptomyces sp. NPDC046915]|uniref:WD40 repeat domain-containing protein n=1 Tax=Streptomyces sp. NPDC046915 TaxID=3155257 RepID=UPI0033D31BBB